VKPTFASCCVTIGAVLGAALAAPVQASYPGRNGRIVFQPFNAGAGEGNPDSGIFTVGPDGSSQRKLTGLPRDADHPVYSPDGRHLAYDLGPDRLFVASASGTHIRLLTRIRRGVDSEKVAWSPNGRQLAIGFSPPTGGALANAIGVIDADGTGLRIIVRDGFAPTWSTKSRVAFDRGGSIWSVDPNGRHLRRLTRPGGDNGDENPSWSPDGRHLLFDRANNADPNNPVANVYEIDANGAHLTRLTASGGPWEAPVWSPDGRQIVVADRGATGQLWVMNANGSGAHQITHHLHAVRFPDWQPLH
jgi:Tol biopolymer transport system component